MVVAVGVQSWWSDGKGSEWRNETVLQSLQRRFSSTELYTLRQQISFYVVTICCALRLLQYVPEPSTESTALYLPSLLLVAASPALVEALRMYTAAALTWRTSVNHNMHNSRKMSK